MVLERAAKGLPARASMDLFLSFPPDHRPDLVHVVEAGAGGARTRAIRGTGAVSPVRMTERDIPSLRNEPVPLPAGSPALAGDSGNADGEVGGHRPFRPAAGERYSPTGGNPSAPGGRPVAR